jgi:predicted dehydrogenase
MGTRRAKAIAVHPGVELSGVEDLELGRAQSLGRVVGCAAFDSLDSLLSTSKPDAAFICVPNLAHAEYAVKCLSAGCHVFCEKPLARNPAEARQVLDASRVADREVQVGSNLRWFGNVLKAKELIDSGILGRILFARGWIGHDGWVLRDEPWSRELTKIGGGTMIDNGPHILDLLMWFLGDIRRGTGHRSTRLHSLVAPQEDNFFAVLETSTGVPLMVQSSWTEWSGYLYLEVYGESGSICVDCRGQTSSTSLRPRLGPASNFDFSAEGPVSFQRETNSFLDCILEGKRAFPSASDGLRVLEIIDGLYRSAPLPPL